MNSSYAKRIAQLHKELGIPEDYAAQRKLNLQYEPDTLIPIENDIFSRLQQLTVEAASCWNKMREAAKQDDVIISVVSAFRSVDYQADIIRRKLTAGQSIEQVLAVSAAPGYSEHHTGRCLDLTTLHCKPLEEEFENTTAFEWLTKNAKNFGFSLSYPRNNPHRVVYEPWHWLFN
jgi:D-alanyl-D-alanine carboxypeptidase